MDVLRKANTLEMDPVLQLSKPVIHCEVGQPLEAAPLQVLKAARKGLRDNKIGYTDAFGVDSLREKIARNYNKKYGVDDVKMENVIVTTGSSAGFLLSFISAFDEGDLVAVASCGYPCYTNILSSLNCNLLPITINEEYKLTAKELRVTINQRDKENLPKIKGVILSSPSNPTGA